MKRTQKHLKHKQKFELAPDRETRNNVKTIHSPINNLYIQPANSLLSFDLFVFPTAPC